MEKGANVNATDQNGNTPLHLAARNNNKEVVEALLGKDGINVNIGGKYGKKTPLHLAAQNNNKEIVDALIKAKANVNIKDEDEKTPLHLAAANDHKEVVEVLLKAEGINVNTVDENGKTPFDLTTNEEIKTLLKAAEKPDINLVDE